MRRKIDVCFLLLLAVVTVTLQAQIITKEEVVCNPDRPKYNN